MSPHRTRASGGLLLLVVRADIVISSIDIFLYVLYAYMYIYDDSVSKGIMSEPLNPFELPSMIHGPWRTTKGGKSCSVRSREAVLCCAGRDHSLTFFSFEKNDLSLTRHPSAASVKLGRLARFAAPVLLVSYERWCVFCAAVHATKSNVFLKGRQTNTL